MIRDRIVVEILNRALSERTPDESQTHTGESQDTNEAMRDLTRAEANPEAIGGQSFCSSSLETTPQGKLSNGVKVTALQESCSPNECRHVHELWKETLQVAAVPSQGHHFCISMHHSGNNMKGIHY